MKVRTRLNGAVVWSDLVLIESVLMNLISNAVRYSEQGDTVLIESRKKGDRIVIDVCDTGVGIPADQLENIFSEFYQLGNPERDREKGLGLGLSIVKRMLKLLPDHAINVSSIVGKGSRFRISMPAANELPDATQEIAAIEFAEFDGLRVLILEDDPDVRNIEVILLREWGCEVADADCSADAIAVVRDGWEPHVIIADYRLPGATTGVQAVQAIRDLLKQQIPALIVTGETQAETLRNIEAAELPLLHKPVVPAKLMLFLRQYRTKRHIT